MGKHLTEIDRYKIEFFLEQKLKVREIAERLGKCENTIRNEIKRGTVELIDSELKKYKKYCADAGQRVIDKNKELKGRPLKIGCDFKLAAFIENMILVNHYSPEAVSAEIVRQGLSFDVSICFKTIYNYIHNDVFLNLTDDIIQKYKIKNRSRNKHKHTISLSRAGKYIDSRPSYVSDRSEYGHWEIDTVYSGKGSKACLLVLTERATRKEIIRKIKSRTQREVIRCINNLEKEYTFPGFCRTFKTITADNGVEFLDFNGIEYSPSGKKRTEMYYCHPYHSWERGTNENHNRMIRRFIPKKTTISKISSRRIREVEDFMNNYPRKILGWHTPAECEAQFRSEHAEAASP